jgi:hypothetical protein
MKKRRTGYASDSVCFPPHYTVSNRQHGRSYQDTCGVVQPAQRDSSCVGEGEEIDSSATALREREMVKTELTVE